MASIFCPGRRPANFGFSFVVFRADLHEGPKRPMRTLIGLPDFGLHADLGAPIATCSRDTFFSDLLHFP